MSNSSPGILRKNYSKNAASLKPKARVEAGTAGEKSLKLFMGEFNFLTDLFEIVGVDWRLLLALGSGVGILRINGELLLIVEHAYFCPSNN